LNGDTGSIFFNANFATTNGGNLTVNHDGVVDFADGIVFDVSGTTRFVGPGRVLFGDITYKTNSSDLIFDQGVVQLTADTTIDTADGNVVFKNEVRGGHDLVINAGNGLVLFEKAVGDAGQPLDNLRITAAGGAVFLRTVTLNEALFIDVAGGVSFGGNVSAGGSATVNADGSVTATGTVIAGNVIANFAVAGVRIGKR